MLFVLEAPIGIGPMNKGFADLCLTAWLWRPMNLATRLRLRGDLEENDKNHLDFCRFSGADYGARTRHLDLGKVALYQMS